MDLALARRLSQPASTKIILCVLDGLGGLPKHGTLRSELEQAVIPNLDRLATSLRAAAASPSTTVPVRMSKSDRRFG